ncbi:hypothetical protein VII00023_14528 [Vibrio ichthyoenteri ATCC 700023]|uniref:Uncharacterized protein n=1 Tax=Vibrio ichthyoenteri ATCC 700023 TaxID=870968 RepID=F9S5F8_9VIBR|nr:hypothetical protein [Vibrio ichthyoenteri]EGU35900.1 hypothetical protein VII00023_14528 [Vibrio ichthyoenteri ATCC 700023]
MKKSEVIVDITKIYERLDKISATDSIDHESKEELKRISSGLQAINEKLKAGCIAFSITARAQTHPEKCRFCGR